VFYLAALGSYPALSWMNPAPARATLLRVLGLWRVTVLDDCGPVLALVRPLNPTPACVNPTQACVNPTQACVNPTQACVYPTSRSCRYGDHPTSSRCALTSLLQVLLTVLCLYTFKALVRVPGGGGGALGRSEVRGGGGSGRGL
jgi:hypothetical protein